MDKPDEPGADPVSELARELGTAAPGAVVSASDAWEDPGHAGKAGTSAGAGACGSVWSGFALKSCTDLRQVDDCTCTLLLFCACARESICWVSSASCHRVLACTPADHCRLGDDLDELADVHVESSRVKRPPSTPDPSAASTSSSVAAGESINAFLSSLSCALVPSKRTGATLICEFVSHNSSHAFG